MAERSLPTVTPDYFQILVVRELRKVGLELTDPRVYRRTELSEPEQGFLLEVRVWLRRNAWEKRALVACRRQDGGAPIGRAPVDDLAERMANAQSDVGLLFATTDFGPDALEAAAERSIALLRLVDARTAYDAGGWGDPGHYPSWLPAYLVELVDRDQAGQARRRLLEAGRADFLLERLQGGSP